ncbi:VOC family protein [Amycolatopsis sp. cmx-4-61]|uniref:VOC family protein n=1 Tax=Amycolatopsis sp. cmx-4-61 TaxID=2790937 RepID=UPI00397913DB
MTIRRMDNIGIVVDDPDGHGRLELMKFHAPAAPGPAQADAPVNAFGLRRIMFAVEDIEAVVARVRPRGGEPLGELVQYGTSHRLHYLRGPEGIIVALAEQLR